MDRRSFLLTLFGGSIVVASGGALAIQPASSATLAPDAVEKLDATEAEFSQYRHHERPVRRGPPPHAHGRGPRPYWRHRHGPPPGYYRRRHRRYYRRHRW